jgi:Na+/proline symporter
VLRSTSSSAVFLAVAWTDFIQMIVLVVGLSIMAVYSAAWPVVSTACWRWRAR